MQIRSIAGVVIAAALMSGFIGCNARPVSLVEVDQSVLPVSAKSLLSQDAVIGRVEKETYADGNEIYVMHYTQNGEEKSIKVNPKDYSEPSRVFQSSGKK